MLRRHNLKVSYNGRPIDPARNYRISVNNFLASGGDGYTVFASGTDALDAGPDLDALEAWLKALPPRPPSPPCARPPGIATACWPTRPGKPSKRSPAASRRRAFFRVPW